MTDNAAPRNRGKPGFTSAVREVVLIVIGVLIALSLEGLWQDRTERIAERNLLLGLTNEFVDNSRALRRTRGGHRRIVASAEEFIVQVEAALEGQGLLVPDSLIGNIARTPRYRPDMNTLEAALSSGQITLIRSAEVQRALASWRGRLIEAQQEEQAGADLVYGQIFPHLGAVTSVGPALSWLASDLRRLGQGLPSRPWPSTTTRIVASRGLTNLLWVRYRLSSAAVNELEILQQRLDEVLVLLEAELR